MLLKLENMICNDSVENSINYLKLPDYINLADLNKPVPEQMRLEFLIVPPITRHFFNNELVAKPRASSYEVLFTEECKRLDQELVATSLLVNNKP